MRRIAMSIVLASLALLATAAPALAHTTLIGSNPAEGATVVAAPPQLELRFNEPVQAQFSTVTVSGPSGAQWQLGQPAARGGVLTVPVRAAGPPGGYTIGYRVLSADGHPVTGVIRLTLVAPATTVTTTAPGAASQPNQPAQPAPAAVGQSPDPDRDVPIWPWIVAGVVLLGATAVVVVRIARRSTR